MSVARPKPTLIPSNLQPTVKFESVSALRTFTLNRPKKLNALDEQMLSILRPKIEVCCYHMTRPLAHPEKNKILKNKI